MNRLLAIALPILIVALGVAAAAAMVLRRGEAETRPAEELRLPVEVVPARPAEARARLRATGTVTAEQQVSLSPQVSGRVVAVHPRLRPGARLAQGELLARIDPRDYEAALALAESQLAQAEVNLELERGRSQVARREWDLVAPAQDPGAAPLALRGPQLKSAEAALKSAQASVQTARLNLERTAIRAPFDALVLSEAVDVGQIVGPGSPVASLVGDARMRVELKLPAAALPAIELPGADGSGGSPATIRQLLAGAAPGPERAGRVLGLGGQIDPSTRTVPVLVEIEAPLEGELPLLPGAFVEVELAGRPTAAVALPGAALREGEAVWTVGEGERLLRRPVQVGWREGETIFVTAGLSEGERVVTSPLSLPVEGLAVQVLSGSSR